MSTIVAGYDMSPESDAALDWAFAQAGLDSSRLVVIVGGLPPHPEVTPDVVIEHVEARLAADGLDGEVVHLAGGAGAAASILDHARLESADLIVLGQRRRSPVGKLVMGSTVQTVLFDAECPVVTVKAPKA